MKYKMILTIGWGMEIPTYFNMIYINITSCVFQNRKAGLPEKYATQQSLTLWGHIIIPFCGGPA
jgi:hypothetical protein